VSGNGCFDWIPTARSAFPGERQIVGDRDCLKLQPSAPRREQQQKGGFNQFNRLLNGYNGLGELQLQFPDAVLVWRAV
jgi:hypothetical protein